MDIVIPITVIVLGCALVVSGTAIRLGIAKRQSALDLEPELVAQISRGGVPVIVAGAVSLGTGFLQWYTPLPTVGWLAYTLALLGLLFLGAARIGGW